MTCRGRDIKNRRRMRVADGNERRGHERKRTQMEEETCKGTQDTHSRERKQRQRAKGKKHPEKA